MKKMSETLSRIENSLKEIQNEQEEKNSRPPIVASLEAISNYYMDYISKQKGENEK